MSAFTSRYLRLLFTRSHRPDWRPPVLSPRARHLAEVLSNYADDTGQAFPTVETLAERMGIVAANVRRARAELVEAGVIAMEDGGGRHRSNVYRFPVQGWLEIVHNPRAGAGVSESTTRAPGRGNPRADARPKDHEVPRITATDAVPRGVPVPAADHLTPAQRERLAYMARIREADDARRTAEQ